jgi:hypothetical protein
MGFAASADDSGDDDLVTASACPRWSQDITGVTAGEELSGYCG